MALPQGRTLVLCFDGTADQYDSTNTNVVKFYDLLSKDDTQQLCYYQPGVGTYVNPSIMSPIWQWIAKVLDEAVAWYLDEHVRGGYEFLVQTYRPGDKICIFGFSRGAYTARAVAGLLYKVGLLPKNNPEQIPFAYKLYKSTSKSNEELARGFKQTFCRSVNVEFLGVWDTVEATGILWTRSLPFTASDTAIKTFRHALSLDEHRTKFRPSLYHRSTPSSSSSSGTTTDSTTPVVDAKVVAKLRKQIDSLNRSHMKKKDSTTPAPTDSEAQDLDPQYTPITHTDVLEVWFAGCHADIGGSAVPNSTKECLSNITLHWMVREVVKAQCGICFDSTALLREGIPTSILTENIQNIEDTLDGAATGSPPPIATNPSPGSATNDGTTTSGNDASQSGNSENDALQPIHDELKEDILWWLLEIIPTSYTWQDTSGKWHTTWSIHLGKGRYIPYAQPNFHVSVKERMADASLKYIPRARWTKGSEVYTP
ncbi:hypothetical protein CERSUDRAFT_81159 [Gelatoporia subvermispora B]|uniref:T6SS Phospholipase effector Tle1-like catalytic domain-containing protein n=1 Tax=Ceriporiopsis subvermispora (strain B) TaxID=914234 RepID=M2R5G0_CERS8|nr:hypothetical protein CERSUDRAFT_81159 [Gelatoporia subvermispora B]